jgi:flavin-dependent dehydrogenase
MNKFDVAVIGGGPAGTSLAISLERKGLTVLVAERSDYQEWRAGETLSPKASIPLSKLGIMSTLLLNIPNIASQAIHASWGSPKLVQNHSIINPYGHGWHLDRSKFDSTLASAAEDLGATILRGVHYSAAIHRGRWNVSLRNASCTFNIEAKLLVDATGRLSQVARGLGASAIYYDQLIALVGTISADSSEDSIESVLTLEAVENGWWYIVPIPNGRVVAVFMTDRDVFVNSHVNPTAYWLKMTRQSGMLSRILKRYQLENNVTIKNASTFCLDNMAGPGWLAIGDAACTFDPLAGNGILKALESGIDSSLVILGSNLDDKNNRFTEYVQSVQYKFNNYLIQRCRIYQREQRWPESPFWHRRQQLHYITPS